MSEGRNQLKRRLGQYAHDNACDVEGFPVFAGKIGELRKLCEIVGMGI